MTVRVRIERIIITLEIVITKTIIAMKARLPTHEEQNELEEEGVSSLAFFFFFFLFLLFL